MTTPIRPAYQFRMAIVLRLQSTIPCKRCRSNIGVKRRILTSAEESGALL